MAWHPTLIALQKRVSIFTSLPWKHSEALQLLKYQVGEGFGDHTDFFPPQSTDQGDAASGQRVFTAFFYLNDDFKGGETVFPLLNITVQPKKGRLLLFRNVLRNVPPGRPLIVDGRTMHRGNLVLPGSVEPKYAMNLWVLEKPFEIYRTTLL
jgi:prolyl 4-hydroxylase